MRRKNFKIFKFRFQMVFFFSLSRSRWFSGLEEVFPFGCFEILLVDWFATVDSINSSVLQLVNFFFQLISSHCHTTSSSSPALLFNHDNWHRSGLLSPFFSFTALDCNAFLLGNGQLNIYQKVFCIFECLFNSTNTVHLHTWPRLLHFIFIMSAKTNNTHPS